MDNRLHVLGKEHDIRTAVIWLRKPESMSDKLKLL